MKKRICKFQDTMLETGNFNVHISRCLNRKCPKYVEALNEEICSTCEYIEPTDKEEDESLAEDVFNVILIQRSDQLVSHFYNTYCKQCEHFNSNTKICMSQKCNFAFPIDVIMRNPSINCPLGLW